MSEEKMLDTPLQPLNVIDNNNHGGRRIRKVDPNRPLGRRPKPKYSVLTNRVTLTLTDLDKNRFDVAVKVLTETKTVEKMREGDSGETNVLRFIVLDWLTANGY